MAAQRRERSGEAGHARTAKGRERHHRSYQGKRTRPADAISRMTTEEACSIIVGIIEEAVGHFCRGAPSITPQATAWRVTYVAVLAASACLYGARGGGSSRPFSLIALVPAACVLVVAAEIFLDRRIRSLRRGELSRRLRAIGSELQSRGMEYGTVREPPSRAIVLVRVHRDDLWRMIPANLLVVGDIVQVSPGEHLGIAAKPLLNGDPSLFSIEENPLERQLACLAEKAKLASSSACVKVTAEARNIAMLSSRIHFVMTAILLTFLWLSTSGMEAGSPLPLDLFLYAALGSFIFQSPLWATLFFIYANARLIALVDVLNKSSTPYTEAEDVDEFDEEAPPPTKDIYLDVATIVRNIWFAFNGGSGGSCLFWMYDLGQAFGAMSVISFMDREGPIAMSFPMPLEVMFPSPIAEGELAFGEFIIDTSNPMCIRTNYSDEAVGDDHLRSLGLSLMVSSSCGVNLGHFRRDWHGRFPWSVHPGRKLDPVFTTCPCLISRKLGFVANASTAFAKVYDFWILRDVGISVPLNPIEYQGLFCRIFQDLVTGSKHMFSFGDLTSATCLSKYTWNSSEIKAFPQSLQRKLIDLDDKLTASDMQCIGITYRPIMDAEGESIIGGASDVFNFNSFLDETDGNFESIGNNQIFLGALISGYIPKDDMQEVIDDLENGGIRFVYFSSYSESITKAFGDRLGLETDWNSCIILSGRAPSTLSTDYDATIGDGLFTDSKSKLPRGIHNVRPHLQDVDDIPLHISLFAECDPSSMAEMHRIYNEHEEVVIAVGSTLNWSNSEAFVTAHLAIGMEPANIRPQAGGSGLVPLGGCGGPAFEGGGDVKEGGPLNGRSGYQMRRLSSIALSASLTSLSCPIVLPFDCSPYVITEIVREARCILRSRQTSYYFRLVLTIMIAVALLSVSLMDAVAPPSSSLPAMGRTVHFLEIVATALTCMLATAIHLVSPYEPNIMKMMPMTIGDAQFFWSQTRHHMWRAVLSGAMMAFAARATWSTLGLVGVMFIFTSTSATFLHSILPLTTYGPLQNATWSITMALSLCALCAVHAYRWWAGGSRAAPKSASQVVLHLLTCIFVALLSAAINEWLKRQWRRSAQSDEKRAKLQFNTKLGMHSPI